MLFNPVQGQPPSEHDNNKDGLVPKKETTDHRSRDEKMGKKSSFEGFNLVSFC